MKKLKLTNKGKKILGALASIASLLIILLIFLLLSIKSNKPKTFDVERLQSLIIAEYEALNLREMDQIDLLNKFGIIQEEIPSSLAFMSYLEDKDGNNIANENYIIIINTENYQYYYDMLASQVDSITRYTENKEEFELYSNAILKSDNNYVYLIVSNQAKEIEQLINE